MEGGRDKRREIGSERMREGGREECMGGREEQRIKISFTNDNDDGGDSNSDINIDN